MSIIDKNSIGVTTLGEKGQVVIPAEIRRKLKLKKGDKLIVFAKDKEMIGLSKASSLDKFLSHITAIKNIITKSKKQ